MGSTDRRYQLAVERWKRRAARELTGAVLISQMIREARAAGDVHGRLAELHEQRRACERYYLRAAEVLHNNGEALPMDIERDAMEYFACRR